MTTAASPLHIGLIGNNLGSSLSPALHQAEAAALGLSGYRYEAIDLEQDPAPDLGRVLAQSMDRGFTGFNVTHPYKQAVLPFLDAVVPEAAALGAVNTVVLEDGRLIGHNTDRSGFLAGLHRTLPRASATGSAVLFGAGGAGSAVAAALLGFGVQTLRIIDPDPGRLTALCELLRQRQPAGAGSFIESAGPAAAREWIPAADGVINASPIGMEGIPGTPFDTSLLSPSHWVADVVYRPVTTQLLADAGDLGCAVVNGTTMLVEQAADTFALVTGHQPQRSRMRAHLTELLAPAQR